MNEQAFEPRKIILATEQHRATAVAMLANAPLGIEVMARPVQKVRKPSQNALMWASALKDIAHQAWMEGRRYSEEVWHEHLKREFLPNDDHPDIELLVKSPETWRKWEYLPDGERILAGSTTRLTVAGMAWYLDRVYSFGASMGVLFTAGGHDYHG